MSLLLQFVLLMQTRSPVISNTIRIILFPLKLYTNFFGRLMESCLGCIYIHKSIAPLAMNLAFLAQKSCFDFVLLGEFFNFKNPLILPVFTQVDCYQPHPLIVFSFFPFFVYPHKLNHYQLNNILHGLLYQHIIYQHVQA